MSTIFEFLFEFIQRITEWLGYPGIFILMLLENLLPPIPSEMVMPFGGSLVAKGSLTYFGVLLSGTLGSVIGALVLYYAGYQMGHERLEQWICRYGKYLFLTPRDLNKALDLFQRHGKFTIFLARLIPGVRSLISIPAGVNRMAIGPFLIATLLGTTVWNVVMTTAGYLLGQNWQRVLTFIDTYENVLWAATAAGLLYFIVRKLRRRGELDAQGCEDG